MYKVATLRHIMHGGWNGKGVEKVLMSTVGRKEAMEVREGECFKY